MLELIQELKELIMEISQDEEIKLEQLKEDLYLLNKDLLEEFNNMGLIDNEED